MTNYVSYRVPEDSEMVKDLLACIDQIGREKLVTLGGGGSDANIYNQKGIQAVVLGTGMTKVHTTSECIKISNLNDTARLALALLTM